MPWSHFSFKPAQVSTKLRVNNFSSMRRPSAVARASMPPAARIQCADTARDEWWLHDLLMQYLTSSDKEFFRF
jgi:hypothetical protein